MISKTAEMMKNDENRADFFRAHFFRCNWANKLEKMKRVTFKDFAPEVEKFEKILDKNYPDIPKNISKTLLKY